MDKISEAEVGQMTKLAATALRALSGENQELRAENGALKAKVASFERKEHAERVAKQMEVKGIDPDASFEEKVAGLLKREDLRVVEEAVNMSSPQMKVAGVRDGHVTVEGGVDGAAEASFAAALAE